MAAINSLESNQTNVTNVSNVSNGMNHSETNEINETNQVLLQTQEELTNKSQEMFKQILGKLSIQTCPMDIIRMIFSFLLEEDPLSVFDLDRFFFMLGAYEESEIIDMIIGCLKANFEATKAPLFSEKNSRVYSKKNLAMFLKQIKPSLLDFSLLYDSKSFESLLESENIELYEFLYSIGFTLTKECCNKAIEMQDLDALKWLRTKKCNWDITYCYSEAASKGNLSILKFLKMEEPNFKKLPNGCLYSAIMHQNSVMVKWLLKNGSEWETSHIEYLATTRNLNFIRELREINPPIPFPQTEDEMEDSTAIETLVDADDLDSIEVLKELGYPLNETQARWALIRGNPQLFQCMVTMGFPYDREGCIRVCASKIKEFTSLMKKMKEEKE